MGDALSGDVLNDDSAIASRFLFGDPVLHLTSVPFMRAIGAVWLNGNPQWVHLLLPYAPAVCGGPNGDAVDLRAVAALLDHAGGAAVYAGVEGANATATLDLRLDFMREPLPGCDVRVSAGCAVAEDGSALLLGQAWCDDAASPVARMTARYLLGAGPGEGPVVPDASAREQAADQHTGALAPAVLSFDELLGGHAGNNAWVLPFAPWLVGSVALPALHGAVVVAGLVTAVQQAVPTPPGLRLSSITAQFLRAALADETRFEVSIQKSGGRAIFVDAEATQQQGQRRAATLRCLYC